MKASGAALQGALALGALAVAYGTWQRKPEGDERDVVVLDVGRGDLDKVRYEDGPRWVELERRREGSETVPWIRYGQKPLPGAGQSDGGLDAGAVQASFPSAPRAPDREVKGNEGAQRLLEKFTPLEAVRGLGVLPPAKLKELGLDGSGRRLEVVVRGAPRNFTVSAGTLGTPYLLDQSDGRVYLARGALLMDLDAASGRLVERRLHLFKLAEVSSVAVSAKGKRRELLETASDTGQILKVAPAGNPNKPDEFAKNWLDKVWRLLPTDVLGTGEVPASGAPEIYGRLDYFSKGKPEGFIELARSGVDAYVRTENLSGWAKVHPPDELLAEARRVAEGP